MAKARMAVQRQAEEIAVHEDDMHDGHREQMLEESMDPTEESGRTVESSEEDEPDYNTQEDMQRFEETFFGINERFRLINRIGEGGYKFLMPVMQGHGSRSVLTIPLRHILNRIQG